MIASVVILGCGYTGRRVAHRLLGRGLAVHVTAAGAASLAEPAAAGAVPHVLDARDPARLAALAEVARGLRGPLAVLHSVPLIAAAGAQADPTPQLLAALGGRPARVVYLSTTSVYGATTAVDELTPPAPLDAAARLRVAAEDAVAAGPWSSLVLRPAAIYGPGRGVHVAVRAGRFGAVGAGRHVVSRIHVDDLAALSEAALLGTATGAYPIADELPAASVEVARFAARLLGLPDASPGAALEPPGSLHVGRRVDGRAACRVLGVTLRHPTYLTGLPAAIAEEQAGAGSPPASR